MFRLAWGLVSIALSACLALTPVALLAAEVRLPAPDAGQPIVLSAATAQSWAEGREEVWVLSGSPTLQQDATTARARQAVVWIDRSPGTFGSPRNKVTVYLEGDVEVTATTPESEAPPTVRDRSWLGRFYSTRGIDLRVAQRLGDDQARPEVYGRAVAWRDAGPGVIRRTQFQPGGPPAGGVTPAGTRRLRAFPRSSVLPTIESFQSASGTEWITVIDRGVTLIIDGVPGLGQVDISTDRMVIWKGGGAQPDLTGQALDDENTPLEIYMEGNVDFRQGDRIVRAERMYYDVNAEVGTVLAAELLSPVPNYAGLVRLKADVVRQLGRDQYLAQNAFVTSSRLGRPGYRLQSGEIYFRDQQSPVFDPATGAPVLDAEGEQLVDHARLATSRNNFIYLSEVPVFYWPRFATDLEDPNLFFRRVKVKNDRIFGTQILTDWDGYQLFGWRNPPAGTDLNLSLDYLSERGPAGGPTFTYRRDNVFGYGGPTFGLIDSWFVRDTGQDNLGLDRREIEPERLYRHRQLWRHRQQFAGNNQLTAEAGWISDRNFLEQYYEREWDQFKDQTTGLEFKHFNNNSVWSINADTRLNQFFTQTEWLPRADHFWLGQPLFGGRLNWSEHSQVGYARLRVSSFPNNPTDAAAWVYRPWEVTSEGERILTRQSLELPVLLGPLKLVPYALGELGHWGQDLTGDDIQRAYGQAGLRAALPFWRANPGFESQLLNVHGLAHKAVLDAEFSYADANRDLNQFPLYDNPDDDSIEHFRRRYAVNTFGGTIPPPFDERSYAFRSGLQNWVTSPTAEIADDLMALRMGLAQRWQTKRGLPGQRRIIDWMLFDVNATWFPEADRDNFGQDFGLVDYDYRWHVGDRFTLLSSGGFDFFTAGNQTVTVGGFLNRPPRGSLYLGFRYLEGPISSRVINAAYSYRMSPKWVSTLGTSVDVAGNGNIGQYGTITRIGESLLFSLGFNVDASKGNVGAMVSVEPRFLPRTRLGRAGGAQIPVAGATGLE